MNWKALMLSGWFVRFVLVLWLVSSVLVVYLLLMVDWIVHDQLYDYGLQFSIDWAAGYWTALRAIFVALALPSVLSVVAFGLEVWRFVKEGRLFVRREAVQEAKPVAKDIEVAEPNHMLISCPKCKRVFSRPLLMLDFSVGKTRLLSVCPYCSQVLGDAESSEAESGKVNGVELVDLEGRKVRQKSPVKRVDKPLRQ